MISNLRLNVLTQHLKKTNMVSRNIYHKSLVKEKIDVLGSSIAYYDSKNHDNVVLFLHGNPTSSYLWRNITPIVEPIARCVAPDLIGMGDSSKVDQLKYTFDDHFKYLDAWIENMDFKGKINLVVHDWGSALGFHWANLNKDRIASITHMESLVCPLPSWDEFPENARNIFQAMRSPNGEELVLKKNFFVKKLLPLSIMRKLSKEETQTYEAPFHDEKSRLPTLTWPREIPIKSDGPANVVGYATDYNKWLQNSKDLPKLYIDAEPGFFAPLIRKVVEGWPNQQVVSVKGVHFIQEDSPVEIGEAIRNFLQQKVFTS